MRVDPFPISSQTSEQDRTDLLGLQCYVRDKQSSYTYLEIGSYLGGTLAPHVVDPRCQRIYSIDKRVTRQPDPRRADGWPYRGNTTAAMLGRLSELNGGDLSKLTTFECDAIEIEPRSLRPPPDLAFIDGEHTYLAVVRDWSLIGRACPGPVVVAFHDAELVTEAVEDINGLWKTTGRTIKKLCESPSLVGYALGPVT